MKKPILYIILPILFLSLTAARVHKYHMALYQIEYAQEKKMLQITARIHIEDINKGLAKKYNKKMSLGEEKQEPEDVNLLKEYVASHFVIKVNNQLKPMNFLSQEIEGDEIVCYLSVKNVSPIKTLDIENTILIELFSDQQNRINVIVSGEKKSFLLTNAITSKSIKY
ncbi:DUF6702 family protein [Flavobacterium nackdongense]|uniref:Peptidase E n=1 Tax=Flavobacterium nackdongense TaxID=2547394 RepID=A0A4P6Y7Y2_9FLAO|nr:DUF6702 family protein [Flavobacterium nackdongense]QBN18786.1 hypothetical protein E1750_08210 [Flavobacterium nackdongense]